MNPGMLGTAQEFRKRFENPILRGRDADAVKEHQEFGESKLKEMLAIVNKCIIRRTSALLTKYLPVNFKNIKGFTLVIKNLKLLVKNIRIF